MAQDKENLSEHYSSGRVFHGALKLFVIGMGVGGHVQAGWSALRDAMLNWRFSKETLFQFCSFMVGTAL